MLKVLIFKAGNMSMKLDIHKLKKLRESKAWNQTHLADVSGMSLRTIQRIEKSGKVSQGSAMSICSAYDILVEDVLVSEIRQVNTDSSFLAELVYQIKHMDKKASILSFCIAFIVAYFWSV